MNSDKFVFTNLIKKLIYWTIISIFLAFAFMFAKISLEPYIQLIFNLASEFINNSVYIGAITIIVTLLIGLSVNNAVSFLQKNYNQNQYDKSLSIFENKVEAKKLIHDNPIDAIEQLKFNRKEYVHEIIEIIESININNENKIIKIAIFGEWGTGKSSIMKPIYNSFFMNSIWFDAWQHQKEECLVTPLLLSIYDKAEEDQSLPVILKKFCCNKSCLLNKVQMSTQYTEIDLGFIKQKIPSNFIFHNEREEFMLARVRLREIFKELKNRFIHEDFPLIIFIDNLDRVEPEKAVAFLDSMHILSEIDEKAVFIFGLDEIKIKTGVENKYNQNMINLSKPPITTDGSNQTTDGSNQTTDGSNQTTDGSNQTTNGSNNQEVVKSVFKDYIDKIFDYKYELLPIDSDSFITEYLDSKAIELQCTNPNLISAIISIGTRNPRQAIRVFNQFKLSQDYFKNCLKEHYLNLEQKPDIICKLTVLKECFPNEYIIFKKQPEILLQFEQYINGDINSVNQEDLDDSIKQLIKSNNYDKITLLIETGSKFASIEDDIYKRILRTIFPHPIMIQNIQDFINILQSNDNVAIKRAKEKAKNELSILSRRKLVYQYIDEISNIIST